MDPETHRVIKGQRKEAPVWPMVVPGGIFGCSEGKPTQTSSKKKKKKKRCFFGKVAVKLEESNCSKPGALPSLM